MSEIVLTLPDSLAEEARESGLLSNAFMTSMLKEELRRRKGHHRQRKHRHRSFPGRANFFSQIRRPNRHLSNMAEAIQRKEVRLFYGGSQAKMATATTIRQQTP